MIDSRVTRFVASLKLREKPVIAQAVCDDPLNYFMKKNSGAQGDFLLDGAGDAAGKGRYSIAGFNPLFTIRVKGNSAVLKAPGKEFEFRASPPEIIEWMENICPPARSARTGARQAEYFDGGFLFVLSYEMNRFYENAPCKKRTDDDDMWCAFYPDVRVFDAVGNRAFDVSYADSPPANSANSAGYKISGFECDESMGEYIAKIKKIKNYIENGDVYQVNLSRKLTAKFSGNFADLYRDMRRANPASYGACINAGNFKLLSLSPEMFFRVRRGVIETGPIKGTAPRGKNSADDNRLKEKLLASQKERAENIMIVDLMRSDFSRICLKNSVRVTRLMECESLPSVHHLVSEVRGELPNGENLSDILQACYPGGSITGAPKIRAMEIIAELETSPRGFYCGSVIARGLNGSVTASLLIRTLIIKNGVAEYRTGGGITADSDPEEEFRETMHKAAVLNGALRKQATTDA